MRKITFCCIVIIITLFNNIAYTQTIVGTDLDPNYPIINPGDSFTAKFQISNTTGQNITGYLLFRSRSPGGHYEFAPDANGNYSQLITITPGTNWYSKVCVLYSSASPGVYSVTYFISPTTSWGDYWDAETVNDAFEVLTPPDPELIGYDLDPNYPMVLPGESFNSDFQIYNAGSQSISGYLHFRSRSPAGHYEFLPDGNGNYSKFVTITSGTNWYPKECVLYSGADPGVYDVTLFISPTTSWGDYWDVLQVNDAIEVLDEGPDDFFVEAANVSQSTLQPGQTFNASCEQHYSGNSSTTLNPELGYYLSTNTTYGSSDVLLDVDGSTLDKDDLYDSENQDLTIPSGTSEGPYYILFFADHIDEYPESNENNNISYVQITIDIPDPPSIVGTDLDPDYPQIYPDESFTANYQISNTTGQNITGYLHFRSRSPAGHYEFLPDANGNYSKLITITPGTNWYSQECVLYSSATPGVYNVTYFISPTTSWGDYWDAVTVNNTLEVLEVPDPVIVGYDLDPDYPSISPGESFTANYQILNGGNQNITGYLHFRSRSPGGHYEFLPDDNGNYSKLITITPGTNWYSQECVLYSSAGPGVYDVTYFISPTTSWGDYWDAETLNNAFEVKGINILQPESNITVNQGDIVDIEWEGAAESGWAVSLKYDEDEIWDNSNETWIAWGLPISGTYEWDTENIEPGVYHIGGMISDNVDYEYDYASSTVEILPGYGATLELYRVTDTQGTQNTDDPGNIISDFIPGSTVRVTMRAINTGASIPVQCVLNIIGPDNVTVAYDSNIEGANNSTDSPLESGEGYDYYSFDWLVPNYAETGTYDIGAALRDEFDFDLLYETTCDGPNTDFNCDWIIEDQFSVIPTSNYSSTSIGALTELANLRGVFSGYGNLHDLYEDNKKQLAYFSASFVLGVAIYIDLADYYSAMYPNDYITEEGRDGWITVWIDGSVGFDFSVLPAGFGLSAPLDFVPPDCDPKRNMWSIDAINSSMPFLQTDGIQWQWDNNNGWSFDWGNISTSPTTEISANIVKLGRNVARFEVQKETLDLIVDNGITNGVSGPGAITNNAVIIARIHNICSEIVDFKDYWKVIPQLFQTRQFTQFDNGENPQIAGVLNHLRGGYDINYDNIPDNYYPISATNIFGVPLIVLEDYVTFHNIGEELTDFYVKVTDVPSGWWITAWDGGIIPPAIDHKFRIDNVPIHNWTDGDEAETTWGISATENAPDMAIVTFELRKNNHNPLVEGELLDTKTDTLFKIDALNNVPPQITFLEPNVDVTKFNGEPIQLIWDDEDVNNNAFINIAIDPDLSNQPWIGSPNHVWIAQGIDEDPDGIYDTFEWDISGLSVGSYSLWIAIADGIADPVFSRAPGIVNILDNGYLTEIIINSSAEMWYNSNPNIDIDFKNIFGLNNIWYQIDSNDDNNPSNWHSLTSDGASVLSESQNCPGTIMNTDWMISNVDWTALPMNAQTLGMYHLYFKVTDDLGNTFITPDENDAFEFRKDIFPPTVSVYYPTPNLVHNSSTLTANWYSGDLITGLELSGVNKVYFKLNTESSYNEVDASTNSHIYSGLSDGLYTFYIYAIDNANNQSNEIVVDFEINTAINPPTPFALTDPNIGELTTITPLLHWQISTDPDGTPVEYELYYADNVEYNNQTIESNLTSNSFQFNGSIELDYDQQYYWKVKAIDGNGQERWCNQLDWWFETEIDQTPQIAVSTESVDFGFEFIGNCTIEEIITITNTGGGIATGNVELQDLVKGQINNGLTNSNKVKNVNDFDKVKSPDDEGGQKSALDFEITEGGGSFSLAAGISKEIKVRFCPQSEGDLDAILAAVGSGETNSISSNLFGEGVPIEPPQLTFTPPSLDFGTILWLGQDSTQTVELANIGGSVATGIIPYADSSPYPVFYVSNISTGSNNFELQPGESLFFDVTFSPYEPYPGNSTIIIDADDPCNDPILDVSGDAVMLINVFTYVASPQEGGYTIGGGDYWPGDTACISAIPYPGYEFDHWYGGGSDSGTGTVDDSSFCFTVAFPTMTQYYMWGAYFRPIVELDLKVFLEGPFTGSDMNTNVVILPEFPLTQPFNNSPWFYNGDEAISSIPNPNIVDWVLVELRQTPGDSLTATEATRIARKAAFLLNDGSVVDLDGASSLRFDVEHIENLFVVIWHQNHLAIMSADPIVRANNLYSYDFTTSPLTAYGGTSAQKELAAGMWGMIGADGDANGIVEEMDKSNWAAEAGLSGYTSNDFNLNGQVENSDKNDIWWPNLDYLSYIPASYITSDTNYIPFYYIDGWMSFDVFSNVSWTVSNPCSDWLTVSPMSGTYNETISFGFTQNWEDTTRICTLTFAGGGITYELVVEQEGFPYCGIDPHSIEVGSEAGSYVVDVVSNGQWYIQEECFPGDWISFSPTEGTKNGSFTVTYSENTTGIARCCDLRVYYTSLSGVGMIEYNVHELCQDTGSINFVCDNPLIDTRNGKVYNTVQIGEQCWMAENLNIGTMVNGSSNQSNNGTIEKYCYDNIIDYCNTYGGLYQWNEMMEYITTEGTQGICPIGWHIPSDDEWKMIEGSVDSQYNYPDPEWNDIGDRGFDVGQKLKSLSNWNSSGGGTDDYGFTALPSGLRAVDGAFYNLNNYVFFRTSTLNSDGYVGRRLSYYNNAMFRDGFSGSSGNSVRCLKDENPQTWSCGEPMIDDRDDQSYNTVQIDDQCWMAENLNYGNIVNLEVDQTDNGTVEKYCIGNLESNCDIYGANYQWTEIMNYILEDSTQGICPDGWHIPSDAEWCTMENFVDIGVVNCDVNDVYRGTDVGDHLKSQSALWILPTTEATNNTGFSALPGGYYNFSSGQILGVGEYGQFFTSSFAGPDTAWTRGLENERSTIRRKQQSGEYGQNLRCIKD